MTPTGDEQQVATGDEGKTYKGQWIFVDGKRVMDGLGVLEFPDGSVYRGQFDKDRM